MKNLLKSYLGTVELDHISSMVKLLRYKYIQGNHEPSNITQYLGVTEMLIKLHEKGYVHGDVRLENIIFTEYG